MRTVIQQGHVVDVPACPLTRWEADTVTRVLGRVEHIPVRAVISDRVVHLYPRRPLSTLEEVTVLRAFTAVTDARVAFHGDIVWAAA